ncbi:MAG: HAMP domain-containing protein, partial [Chloroflexales bacterium]|nr:HAMP domain-containing protein [Chloroflexales bacterium]
DPRTRPWYVKARDSRATVWTDTYVDANTGDLTTTCATPLYDEGGHFIGVVAFDLLLHTIQHDLLSVNIGEQGIALMVSEAGNVIVRPNLEAHGQSWNRPFSSENLLESPSPALRRIVEKMTNRESGVDQIDFENQPSYIAYAPITTAGWSVALIIPTSQITKPAQATGERISERQDELRAQLLLLLVGLGIAISILGLILSLSFSRRIIAVRQGVQAVASGDLGSRLPAAGGDEIGQLVDAFNSMADALQGKLNELEDNARQLATLNTISNELKGILQLPQLLETIPHAICERFDFDRAVVYLVEGQHLQVASASFGPADEARHFIEVANSSPLDLRGATIEADVIRSGKAIIVDNPWTHPGVEPRKQAASASHSYVQVPIFGREGRPIGLLSADCHSSQRPILAQDASRLLMFAGMVGLTIQNVQLYSDLERQVARRTEELRAALERAQIADQRKSDFLASLSHELRTPLNAIIGFSTVLLDDLDGPLSPAQREDMQSINRNGRFLLHLINELLDLARIEAGHLRLEITDVDLRQLIGDVVDTVQGIIRTRAVTLAAEIAPELPAVAADADRVRQVLLNLLSNAVKFTERGSITVIASCIDEAGEAGSIERYVRVRVSDTGIGIPPDRHGEVFQEFVQIHGRRSRINGTGLGLSITRRLIEAQRGRIWLQSAPGQGSTFSFTLPVATGAPEQHEDGLTPSGLPRIIDGSISTS